MVEATTSKALNVRGERKVAVKLDPLRQVTTDDTGAWTASNAIDWDWILASWCLEPNQIKSVLSVFIFSRFAVIQLSATGQYAKINTFRSKHTNTFYYKYHYHRRLLLSDSQAITLYRRMQNLSHCLNTLLLSINDVQRLLRSTNYPPAL